MEVIISISFNSNNSFQPSKHCIYLIISSETSESRSELNLNKSNQIKVIPNYI